jgi:hypothetical protein
MTDIESGQVWEVYSENERRWIRLIVTKVEGEMVTLRYEGVFEFLTINITQLQEKPDVFRPTEADSPP